jgi:hypothetical protein
MRTDVVDNSLFLYNHQIYANTFRILFNCLLVRLFL